MLLDEFWLGFWGHWSHKIVAMLAICDVVGWTLAWILGALKLWKISCVGLVEENHDECGRFVVMCNLWQNFVGISVKKFCGHGKFLWIWKNFMGMKFWLWKKYFVGYVMLDHKKSGYDFGHVGFFWLCMDMWEFFYCVWLWEKLGSCVWTCVKFCLW